MSRCAKCDREVSTRGGWTEVIGWRKPRNQGGTNHVALPKPTGRMLCEGCMHLARSGDGSQQQGLGV